MDRGEIKIKRGIDQLDYAANLKASAKNKAIEIISKDSDAKMAEERNRLAKEERGINLQRTVRDKFYDSVSAIVLDGEDKAWEIIHLLSPELTDEVKMIIGQL